MVAEVNFYRNAESNPCVFYTAPLANVFVDGGAIVDACTWHYDAANMLKVAIPPFVLARMMGEH